MEGIGTTIQNIVSAHVVERAPFRAAQVTVKLDVGGAPLLARITKKSAAQLNLAPGKAVFAQVKSVALMP